MANKMCKDLRTKLNQLFCIVILPLSLMGCWDNWNSPYDEELGKKILYDNFSSSPKHLDPVRAFSSDEFRLIENIYEPPLQYHYLKRPYELIPLTAEVMPSKRKIEIENKTLFAYDIKIKSGILYAPHPSLKKNRELIADDYIFQIKRLADPKLHSPIASLMAKYIVGFAEFSGQLNDNPQAKLQNLEMEGLKKISNYHYQIILKRDYPQFIYWLAMPFFAPMPAESLQWIEQQNDENLAIDRLPIGTGPFMMTLNDPNYRMILERNPHYRKEYFPAIDNSKHLPENVSQYANKFIPFLDKVIYTLEKESIPEWLKFLQGYYDSSGVSSDNFDQAISLGRTGKFDLSQEFKDKEIQLRSLITTSIYYWGFNMLDPVIGGYSEQQKKLRQAISIALNFEEFIAIFANGRGVVAQSLIPPNIFGYDVGKEGINPFVYDWQNNQVQRKSISQAKELMKQAGYPNGINPKTNQPLVINYEAVGSASGSRSTLDWFVRQFKKIGIQLNIRLTDYTRFRTKIQTGQAQIFGWGWNADYPDPENFFFLLHSKNAKVEYGGENAVNYSNKEYDKLFNQMLILPNGEERKKIIKQMLDILREDAPWVFGWHPMAVGLYHQWVRNSIPNTVSYNTLKYRDIDTKQRQEKIKQWNQPQIVPLIIFTLVVLLIIAMTILAFKRQNSLKLDKHLNNE